jgi:hypothetical protein
MECPDTTQYYKYLDFMPVMLVLLYQLNILVEDGTRSYLILEKQIYIHGNTRKCG